MTTSGPKASILRQQDISSELNDFLSAATAKAFALFQDWFVHLSLSDRDAAVNFGLRWLARRIRTLGNLSGNNRALIVVFGQLWLLLSERSSLGAEIVYLKREHLLSHVIAAVGEDFPRV